jgi:peroxiredoxin
VSLADQLAKLKHDFEAKAPPETIEKIHRATAELARSGILERTLKKGDLAPEFVLPDVNGVPVSSADLRRNGPLIVSFFRGKWCPYCNLELSALAKIYPRVKELGAELVVISPQKSEFSADLVKPYRIGFPILRDFHNEIAEQFGIAFTLPEYLDALYREFGNDSKAWNETEVWQLPIPARFLITPDGTIADAEVNPDYTVRPEPETILERLKALKAPGVIQNPTKDVLRA